MNKNKSISVDELLKFKDQCELDKMLKKNKIMKAQTKMIIDIETSGFSKSKNAICEIAGIVIDDKNEELMNFSKLVRPYAATYHPEAMKVHGIKMKELNDHGEDPHAVVKFFIDLCEQYNVDALIGHNIKKFDFPFLAAFIDRFNYHKQQLKSMQLIDTMEIAKNKIRNSVSYSLSTLSQFYDIENKNAHRALSDCKTTLDVYKCLLKQ